MLDVYADIKSRLAAGDRVIDNKLELAVIIGLIIIYHTGQRFLGWMSRLYSDQIRYSL